MTKKIKKCPECDYEGEMLSNKKPVSAQNKEEEPISYTKTYYCPKCKHWNEIK